MSKTTEMQEPLAALDGEELVEVHLFKDNGKYTADMFVAVNGESCVIQRGKTVQIKRKFADVLEASREQDAKTAELMDAQAEEFSETARKLGV